MTLHVAFLDQFHPRIGDAARSGLPNDWEASFAASRDEAEQVRALAEADVAFVVAARVTSRMLEQAPRLRFIQKMGAGVDNIDVDACEARGIAVAKLAAGNAAMVAEHTVMLILSAFRRLPEMDRRTRAGEWLKEDARANNRQLSGKRVGIIGFGAIGRQLSKRLQGWDVEVVYYDPYLDHTAIEAEYGVRSLTFDEVITSSDVITLHAPLTEETRKMIGEPQLRAMKREALLVNAARGGIVDETALALVLTEGHLLGAAIDVFAQEPPGPHPLLDLRRTVITPHVAGISVENFSSVLDRSVANARSYLAGNGLPEDDAIVIPNEPGPNR